MDIDVGYWQSVVERLKVASCTADSHPKPPFPDNLFSKSDACQIFEQFSAVKAGP
jgi:hypothetical protein